MSSRNKILNRLRGNVRETYDMPDLSFQKTVYDDPVAVFKETATTTAGANLIEMKEGDSLDDLIRQAYPDAKVISSNVEGVTADRNPDTVDSAQDLDGTDVGVILGGVACAENACVWIPQTMKEKAVCFISEYLVIIVDKTNIVSNMHEAYQRIEMPEAGFGKFISGP